MSHATYFVGDVFEVMATMPDHSVDLVLTSPPFLALRSYLPSDHPDKHKEIGSEPTPAEFLDTLLALTAEWGRLIAPHGSIAVELGDTYSGSSMTGGDWKDDPDEWTKYRKAGEPPPKGAKRQTEGWPLAKSLCILPELYAACLAYGRNVLTGEPSPAGQWRVRNLVRWVRPNPPVGALGDKFRPATSTMVVACHARDRWFDLDAVRTDLLHPSAATEAGGKQNKQTANHANDVRPLGAGGASTTHKMMSNPAGAPPLDWWNIPTQPYKGSHYATWPARLCETPIESMCPRQVCATCGEPRRRIVGEAEYVTANGSPHTPHVWASGIADSGAHSRKQDGGVTRQAPTLGWTDCGHGSWCCGSCGVVVPYDHAVHRSREASTGEQGVGASAVLGEPVEGASRPSDGAGPVRGMWDGVPGAAGGEVLHPELFGEAGAQGRATALNPAAPREDGTQGDATGLHPGLGADGYAGPPEERLHDGTPAGDAGASRPSAGVVGDRPSPQRGEGRQSAGEPGSGDESAARWNGDLPALSGDVPGQLTPACPHCGGSDLRYVEDHFRPGIVLDPFAGSGTTLAVATGHGRDAIGIDIDARNADLAVERVGMLLTVEGAA